MNNKIVKDLNITTVLVAGGSGFIGTNFIKNCKKKKWNIISLSINKKIKNNNIREIKLNISNKNLLFKKLGNFKIDYIVNLAGHINHHESEKIYTNR